MEGESAGVCGVWWAEDGEVRYSGWLGSHLECKAYVQCSFLHVGPRSCISNSLAQGYKPTKKEAKTQVGGLLGQPVPACFLSASRSFDHSYD